MNVALWVVAILLAGAFVVAGAMKLARSREQLAASGLAWATDFSPATVKLIGALELAAGIGLVVPALLDIVPVLVPLAALGLVLMMAGAIIVHLRRGEQSGAVPAAVLLVLAAFVAWGRFGPYAF